MLLFMSVGGQEMTTEVRYNQRSNSLPNQFKVGEAGGRVPEQEVAVNDMGRAGNLTAGIIFCPLF